MSTNHNRIKVADLETNQPNKILKTNLNGELEFSDANNLQTENYNALDCTSEGKTLDARQGKVLKDMIDNSSVNLATDPETQITAAVTEDNKVVSRSKLFNWWQWIKSQTQTISGAWNFSNKVTLRSGTKDIPPLIIPNGTLTSNPQNGAIERDENGQLWETHEGIRNKLFVGKGGIELKGEFSNNAQAMAANLKAGDYYSTPVKSNSDTGYIAITKNPPGHMALMFKNASATAAALGINNINSIDDWNAFFTSKGSANFTSVSVTANLIVSFTTNDFTAIKVINLSNIQLTAINLTYLFSVKDIDLSNNELTEFNPNTIPPLLENLKLTNNLLKKFNPNEALPETLKKLILNRNKIVEFEPKNKLPNSIIELNFEENLLESFGDNIEMPTNLKILNLNKNKIGSFSMVVPKFLETLLLSGNNLSDWESNSIHQTNLLLLDLSYNAFSNFDVTGGLPDGIEILKLSHNKMDDFLPSKQLPWALKRLELNDNDFVDFNPKYLAGDDLEIILLQNNKIVTFNPQFLNDTLHKLNLGNNKIVTFNPTRFPSEINTLNLESNPITITGWNTNVNWINSLGTEEGILYAGNTVDSIEGTNTESMLEDLGWTVTKTPYPFL